MKKFKRLTAGLLGVVMALGVCSFTALAGDGNEVKIFDKASLANAIAGQADGQTWKFAEGTYNIDSALEITSSITIEGNNSEIVVDNDISGASNGKKSAIEIKANRNINIVINDLELDGNGGKAVHGINVYSDSSNEVANVKLNNVTITGFKEYGLVNNSSIVIANKLYTYGNKYGVNVDNKRNVEVSKFVMNDGEIEEEVSVYLENSKGSSNGTKATINGGTFKNVGYLTSGNTLSITNGTFANDVTSYMAGDSKLLKDEEGNYVVLGDEAFEKSDKEFYISDEDDLKLAEKYQADGVIWELAEDATYSLKETLQLNKDVVINGNGSTIIFTENIVTPNNDTNCGFNITGGNSEINDLTIKGNGNVKHGINVFTGSGNATKVTIDSVNVYDCKGSGLQNNSSNVKVSNFNTSGNGWSGINVDNKYNIKDANFVMERGNIEEETSVKVEKTPYGNGEQLTTYATIKGGTFGGIVESRGISALTIKGGNFEGEVEADGKENLTITSGEFSNDVSDYLDKGSHLVEDKDGNFVVYEDYLDDKKPSHSYELEEGRVDRNDEEEEPVVTTKPEEEAGPFSDVGKDNPNYDAIIKVYEKGWMAGIGDGVFAPNGTLTRAMGATVLWNKAGKPEPQNVAPFLDVTSDAWYAKAVAWAYEQGIVAGYGETFGPGDALTTEQFTRMNDIANGKTPEIYVGGAPNATRGWVASLLAM